MRQTSGTRKSPGEKIVKEIKRATRKQYSSEEKIRIVLDGLRGEDSIAECDVKPSVRLFQNRLGFSTGKVSKLLSKLRKEKALIGESYVISDRGKCLLHEWFPQSYPEPDSYSAYQAEIPF